MIWVILLASAVGVVVFVERVLHYHRAHINSVEFLNGVRNVLKRDNVVEAISICDATPGPVARPSTTANGFFRTPARSSNSGSRPTAPTPPPPSVSWGMRWVDFPGARAPATVSALML